MKEQLFRVILVATMCVFFAAGFGFVFGVASQRTRNVIEPAPPTWSELKLRLDEVSKKIDAIIENENTMVFMN
jgi:hypothetical protein